MPTEIDRNNRALSRPDLHPYRYFWVHLCLVVYEGIAHWFWLRAIRLDKANWNQYRLFVTGRIDVQMRRPSYAELVRRREM